MKKSTMNSYSSGKKKSLKIDFSMDVVFWLFLKNIKFETHSYGLQF